MIFIGVDPGGSGSIAAVGSNGIPIGFVKNSSTERDVWEELVGWCRKFSGVFAVIESVHSMPKQGVSSSFKFGQSYGFLRGCLVASGVRFTEVSPVKWQTVMRCRTKGDKNISKARAQQVFPQVKITHANADALLLAEYARVTWQSVKPTEEMPQTSPLEQELSGLVDGSRSASLDAEPRSAPANGRSA